MPAKLPCERCRAPAVGSFLASEALHSESWEVWRGTPMVTSQTCSLSTMACSTGPMVTSNDAVLGFCKLDPADQSAEGDSFSDRLSLPWRPGAKERALQSSWFQGCSFGLELDLTHEMDKPLFTKAFSASVGILLQTLLLSQSVQPLSRVRLFATPWIAARQASLFITNSQSLLKLMCIESVMPSNHLILLSASPPAPQSLPSSGSFPMSQLFTWGGQSTGISVSASVLPMNLETSIYTYISIWVNKNKHVL